MTWTASWRDLLVDLLEIASLVLLAASCWPSKPMRRRVGIGPHQGRELDLMLAGRKPVALLTEADGWAAFDAATAEGQLIAASLQVSVIRLRRDVIGRLLGRAEHGLDELRFYARPDEETRLKALCDIFATPRPPFDDCDHATIGWLLGYTDAEIGAFLDH